MTGILEGTRPSQATTVDRDNPWPGLEAFREGDAAFFFGREQPRDELTRLILQHQLVVMHGRSGLGKTSLLRAGVFPRLREAGVLPVYIRLDFRGVDTPCTVASLRAQVKLEVERAAADAAVDAPPLDPGATLWEWFYRSEALFWNERSRRVRPVLVFDQFEEAFTHGRDAGRSEHIDRFLVEIGELVRGSVPAEVALRLQTNSDEALAFRARRDVCGVLLALRHEFLSDLLRLERQLPGALDAHLGLAGMTRTDAERVVTGPGSHLVDAGVAPRIVEFVATARRSAVDETTDDATVDPAILSVFCRELNVTRQHRHLPRITGDLVAGTQKGIIAEFYARSVGDLGPDVQRFIEDKLITESGYRDNINYGQALLERSVTAEAIDALISRRLVRPDGMGPQRRLELTHDVLVDPILASRNERRLQERELKERQAADEVRRAAREAEDRERSERELQATRENGRLALELADQRGRQARNKTRLLWAAGALLLVMGGLMWSAYQARGIAQSNLAAANVQQGLGLMSTGRRAEGLAYIARALKIDRESRAARGLAMDALLHVNWPLPEALLRHEGRVRSAQFSRDGTRLITASDDKTARIWNTADGRLVRTLPHGSAVLLAWFARGQGSVLTVEDAGQAHLWDVGSGQETRAPLVHKDAKITWATASPRDDRIATGADDGSVHVWNGTADKILQNGKRRNDQKRALNSAQFAPGGERLVTASEDGTAEVWDLRTGRRVAPLRHQDPVMAAAFSPDGLMVATASRDGTAGLWDAPTGRRLFSLEHSAAVLTVQFDPNGTRLLTGSDSGDVRLWDTSNGEPVGATLRHEGSITSASFSADGKRILTASRDRTARIWDATDGHAVAEPIRSGSPLGLAVFSPDGQHAAITGEDGAVQVFDIRTGMAAAPLFRPSCPPPRTFRFGSDGKEVTVDCSDGGAAVWNGTAATERASAVPPERHGNLRVSADGELLLATTDRNVDVLKRWSGAVVAQFQHSAPPTTVCLAPNGEMVATVEGDTLRTWDVQDDRVFATLRVDGIKGADFTPDSSRVVTIASGTARIWDARTGTAVSEPLVHGSQNAFASVSADGGRVLTAADRTAKLWDVKGGEPTATVSLPESILDARLSPDGQVALTRTESWKARLWDAVSGRPIATLGRDARIRAAAFSADGRSLVTVSDSERIQLWDPRTGESLSALDAGNLLVEEFAIAPDGQRVGVLSDGVARVWDVPLGVADDSEILVPLLEAVVGYSLDSERGLGVPENWLQALRVERERTRTPARLADRIAAWVVADRRTRAVSPFTGVTVDAYLKQQLASADADARYYALGLFPWHPRVRAALLPAPSAVVPSEKARR